LELVGTRLHLLEQSRVLYGDHSLVGEGRYQFDLFVGEELRFSATENYGPKWRAVPQQRST
jgi:hypothetical protein